MFNINLGLGVFDLRIRGHWVQSEPFQYKTLTTVVKLAVIQHQFGTKECDILRGSKYTLTLPTYFQGVRTSPPPGSTPLVSHPSCRRSIVRRTACEPWCMRIVDDGSPAPTFWSFVLGHDNLSPVEQQRHWVEDTVCLELIRRKDGSIISYTQVQWSDSVQLFILDAVKTCSYTITVWMKECDIFRGQNILWPLLHIFRGPGPPNLQDLCPWCHITALLI